MNSVTKSSNRILSLQGLRSIGFLMIFLWHAGLTETGEIGVSLFFVLSGFVMYLSYKDRDLDTSVKGLFAFSTRKISKLYPLHVVTMLAFLYFEIVALIYSFSVHKLVENIWHVILNLLLVQVWVPKQACYMSLNGVSWFFAVCLFLYLMFPLINKGMKSYTGIKNAIARIILVAVLMTLSAMVATKLPVPETISNNFIKWFTYIFPIYRLGDFVIGCNLAYIYCNKEIKLSLPLATGLEIVSFALLYAVFLLRRYGVFIFGNNFIRFNLVYLPEIMLIVFIIAWGNGLISKLFVLKPFVFVGNISSWAFLIHPLIIRLVYASQISKIFSGSPWIIALIALAITLLLAYLYDLFNNWKRRRNK